MNSESKKILKQLNRPAGSSKDAIALEERMFLRMVNEAAYCLSEHVIQNEEDGDVGAVFGIGFPAYLGGPFAYISSCGRKAVKDRLDVLASRLGDRFKSAPFFNG